ncbi:MAG: DoxX family protein [Ramlibacter sp.]|nr:DoxX family protein [Ramlibacter sp.]
MFLTLDDFKIKASNFDLTESHNVVRILAGFMMLPHAASKFSAGGLNPGTVAFFAKAGMQPAEFMVGLAATAEIVGGLCLMLGLATRWAGLGVATIMALTIVALLNVGPFKWLWNFGGIEYNLFWGLTALAVAVTEFKRRTMAGAGTARRPLRAH